VQFDGGDHFDRDGGGLTVQDAIHESAHLSRPGVRFGHGRVALSAKVMPAAALVALDVQDALHDAVAASAKAPPRRRPISHKGCRPLHFILGLDHRTAGTVDAEADGCQLPCKILRGIGIGPGKGIAPAFVEICSAGITG
jgi:hypothetical protein